MSFTGDRTKKQFLIVGDCGFQPDKATVQIRSFLKNSYPHATILTVEDSATAKLLIAETNLNLIVIKLNTALCDCNTSTNADIKPIENILASQRCCNIVIIGKNIVFSPQHLTAIKNYSGGFVVLDRRYLLLPDLIRYINLAMKGLIYLPQTIEASLKFHPNWVRLLHLKFERGFSDRAIARLMKISDRTVRNYWRQIQHTLLIDEDPKKDIKVLIGIEARRIGIIDRGVNT